MACLLSRETVRTVTVPTTSPAKLARHTPRASCAQPPPRLPPPPASSSLLEVGPYLLKLALSERNLWWRLAAALALMILSKSAGTRHCSPLDPLSATACRLLHPSGKPFGGEPDRAFVMRLDMSS